MKYKTELDFKKERDKAVDEKQICANEINKFKLEFNRWDGIARYFQLKMNELDKKNETR